MPKGSRGSAGIAVVMVLLAIGFAVANVVMFATSGNPSTVVAAEIGTLFSSAFQACPECVAYFAASPLMLGLLGALVASRRPAAVAIAAPEDSTSGPSPDAAALRLLSLLQQEARFIDFVQEDIDGYDDAQVGAAVRTIHADCRKALAGRIELERVLPQEEGSQVKVEKGFDPAAIRLTGKLSGEPPFGGTLQHPGWRATKVQLPESPGGMDVSILAPAEVEIG